MKAGQIEKENLEQLQRNDRAHRKKAEERRQKTG